ncbi:MAG: insulinase family protein [bacterium]|nr:insulinase family protein [bacterium]
MSNTKRILIIPIIIFLLLTVYSPGKSSSATKGSEAANTKYFQLDNGLRVFLEANDKIPLVNIAVGIDVGSKDESLETSGLVHLLEHLVFLGSTHSFDSKELRGMIRKNGVFLNAHTGHDLMTLELTAPAGNIDFALELAWEKILNLNITAKELEKEKSVILEELSQIRDNPRRFGTLSALQAVYAGHPYEKPVGGSSENIKNASTDLLADFYNTFFVPSNCSLSLVGDFDLKTAEAKIRTLFGKTKNRELSRPVIAATPRLKKNVKIEIEKDITGGHLIMAFSAPGLNQKGMMSMNVLSRILGKGMSPLLLNALRGRRRLVDTVSMQYISLKHGGAVLIHMSLNPKKIKSAKKELLKFFRKIHVIRFSKEEYRHAQRPHITDYLETALNSMRFTQRQYKELGLNLAVSYARFLLTNKNSQQKSYKKQMDEIESSDLRTAASDYLSGKKYVMVSIIPIKKGKAGKK